MASLQHHHHTGSGRPVMLVLDAGSFPTTEPTTEEGGTGGAGRVVDVENVARACATLAAAAVVNVVKAGAGDGGSSRKRRRGSWESVRTTGGLIGWDVVNSRGGKGHEASPLLPVSVDSMQNLASAISRAIGGSNGGASDTLREDCISRPSAVPHAIANMLGSPDWKEAISANRFLTGRNSTHVAGAGRAEQSAIVAVFASRFVCQSMASHELMQSLVDKLHADGATLMFVLTDTVSAPGPSLDPRCLQDPGNGPDEIDVGNEMGIDGEELRLRNMFPESIVVPLEAFAGSFVPPVVKLSLASGARRSENRRPVGHRLRIQIGDDPIGDFIVHAPKGPGDQGFRAMEGVWSVRATVSLSECALPRREAAALVFEGSRRRRQRETRGDDQSSCSSQCNDLRVMAFLSALGAAERAALLERVDGEGNGGLALVEAVSGHTATMRAISEDELADYDANQRVSRRAGCSRGHRDRENGDGRAANGDHKQAKRSDRIIKFFRKNEQRWKILSLNRQGNSTDTMKGVPAPSTVGGSDSSKSRSKIVASDIVRIKRVNKLLQREAGHMRPDLEFAAFGDFTCDAVHRELEGTSAGFLTNMKVALDVSSHAADCAVDDDANDRTALEQALEAMNSPLPCSTAGRDNSVEDGGRITLDAAMEDGGGARQHLTLEITEDVPDCSMSVRMQLESASTREGIFDLNVMAEVLQHRYGALVLGDADADEGAGGTAGLVRLGDATLEVLAACTEVISAHTSDSAASERLATSADFLCSAVSVTEADLRSKYNGAGDDDGGLPLPQKLREYTMQILLRLYDGILRVRAADLRSKENDALQRKGGTEGDAGGPGKGATEMAAGEVITAAAPSKRKSKSKARGKSVIRDPLPKPKRREIVTMVGALSFDLTPAGSSVRDYCHCVLYDRFKESLPLTMEKVLIALGLELPDLQLPDQQQIAIRPSGTLPATDRHEAVPMRLQHESQAAATQKPAFLETYHQSQSGISTMPSSNEGTLTRQNSSGALAAAAAPMHFTSFRNTRNLRREVTLRVARKPHRSGSARDASETESVGGRRSQSNTHKGERTGRLTFADVKAAPERRSSLASEIDFVGPTPQKATRSRSQRAHEVVKETPASHKAHNTEKMLDHRAQRILFGGERI